MVHGGKALEYKPDTVVTTQDTPLYGDRRDYVALLEWIYRESQIRGGAIGGMDGNGESGDADLEAEIKFDIAHANRGEPIKKTQALGWLELAQEWSNDRATLPRLHDWLSAIEKHWDWK